MFEAQLAQAMLLKKILAALKDLVQAANWDVSSAGIQLQAMDSSHVALVSLLLKSDGFNNFRADRSIALGIDLTNMDKIMKCAGTEDNVTLKADDQASVLTVMFEAPDGDRVSEFELKLMDIDAEHLGIPDTQYKCTIKMPSSEFKDICKDLSVIGDTITIATTKEGVKFSVAGDMGTGSVVVRQRNNLDKPEASTTITQEEDVTLTFALKFLNEFNKAKDLSDSVSISMSPDVPLVVEYPIGDGGSVGSMKFFLAPKIDEE